MNERFLELALKYLDGEEGALAPGEGQELAGMLRRDAELRRQLAVVCTHAWMLRETYRPEHIERSMRTRRRRRSVVLVAAMAVALCAGLVVGTWNRGTERIEVAPAMATIGAASGQVWITRAGREPRRAQEREAVYPGDRVGLQGEQASVELGYPDGTRLLLLGDTEVSFGGAAKSADMSKGMLLAVVAPQSADSPMTLTTPTARLRVLGTNFSVRVEGKKTDVRVTQGRVAVARSVGGGSVEVSSGKAVLVEPGAPLALNDIPEVPAVWQMDFEDGLPEGMTHGSFVSEGLPAGSRGGVAAVRADRQTEGVYYNIGSPEMWRDGLFAVHPDTHLHVTLKMAKPDWLNFFVICRRFEAQGPNSVNYLFDGLAFWQAKPGQWQTVTVPLSQFKRLANVPGELFEKQTPYKVLFSALEPDRGLVIDRVWVTRGGPGRVTYAVVE